MRSIGITPGALGVEAASQTEEAPGEMAAAAETATAEPAETATTAAPAA